jgi:hypothetical protein
LLKKKEDQTTRRLVTIHYLLYFSGKTGPVTSFAGAFNALNVHQISPNLHENDPLQLLYSSISIVQSERQLIGAGTGLNMPTQAAFSAD